MSDKEDFELQRLRMQRMQALLQQKEMAEKQAAQKTLTLADKIDRLLPVLLASDAFQYLTQIKKNSPQVYQNILTQVFPPEIRQEMDLLMTYLQQGMIRRGIISLTEIQYFERQALGIKSSITIKKQGEDAKSLSSYMHEN